MCCSYVHIPRLSEDGQKQLAIKFSENYNWLKFYCWLVIVGKCAKSNVHSKLKSDTVCLR